MSLITISNLERITAAKLAEMLLAANTASAESATGTGIATATKTGDSASGSGSSSIAVVDVRDDGEFYSPFSHFGLLFSTLSCFCSNSCLPFFPSSPLFSSPPPQSSLLLSSFPTLPKSLFPFFLFLFLVLSSDPLFLLYHSQH